jgi:hypothetical protein
LDQVYFVKGSPLEQVDLHRCHIRAARAFIVLHDPGQEAHMNSITPSSVSVYDWKAILAILAAREKVKRCRLLLLLRLNL